MCWGCRRECRTPSAPEPKPVYLTVYWLFLWAGFPAAGGGRLAGAGAEEAAEGIDAGKAQAVGHGGHRLVRGGEQAASPLLPQAVPVSDGASP